MTLLVAATIAATVAWMAWRIHRANRTLNQAIDQALQIANDQPPLRCLACPDAPYITNRREHSALFHQTRVTGPEDRADWGAA